MEGEMYTARRLMEMDIPKTNILISTLSDGSLTYDVTINLPTHTITCCATSEAHAIKLQKELVGCIDIEIAY